MDDQHTSASIASSPGWRTVGQATTAGQALPLGIDDPVIAARAIRRALAAAGRRATDVAMLSLAAYEAIPGSELARFTRRALGRDATAMLVRGPVDPRAGADELAKLAAFALSGTPLPARGVGLAIGLDSEGTTVALCLQRLDHAGEASSDANA